MKTIDAQKLQKSQKVMHNRYGESLVKEVMMAQGELFGVIITPITEVGKRILCKDSGTNIPDFLEDSCRLMKQL